MMGLDDRGASGREASGDAFARSGTDLRCLRSCAESATASLLLWTSTAEDEATQDDRLPMTGLDLETEPFG